MPEDFQDIPTQTDPIDKLYKTLVNKGYYTKSIDEFKTKYSSPENIDKLYSVVNRDGLYTKTKDEFNTQYFQSVKKKFDTDPHSYLKLFGQKSLSESSPTQSKSQLPYQGTTETSNLPSTSTLKLGATDARLGSGSEGTNERIASPKALGKALLFGASSGISGTLKSIGIAAKELDFFNEYEGKKAEELATYRAGEWVDRTVKDLVGELSPEEQQNFSVKVFSGLGQAATMLGGGIGAKAIKMSPILTTAAIGAATGASSEWKNAIDSGASPEEAAKVFWINGLINSSDAIPMVGVFRKLDKYTGGLATGALAKKLSTTIGGRITNELAQGFITEAAQEATQQILTNTVAKNTYDVTRDIFDGVVESGGIGGIIGSTMTGVVSAIREKRMMGNLTPEENATLDKAEEFAESKIKESEAQEKQQKNIINHAEKVKENLSDKGLDEDTQDIYVAKSLVEKVANEKAEKLTDPTLIKKQKEIAKEAAEIKEQLLAGVKPEDVVTERQKKEQEKIQKEIEEQEKTKVELERLKVDNQLDLEKIDAQIEETDGRESQANRIKLKELNERKKRINEDYQKAVAKLTPKEEVVEAEKTDLLSKVKEKANFKDGDLQYYVDKAGEDPSSAREAYGEEVANELLSKVPSEKLKENFDKAVEMGMTDTADAIGKELDARETKSPSTPSKEVADEISDAEIEKRMMPIAEQMAKAEMELSNEGLEISPDYDGEVIVLNKKTGEQVLPEDIPDNLKSIIGDYETATRKLSEFDEQSFTKTLEKARKQTQGEEAAFEIIQPKQLQSSTPQAKEPSTKPSGIEGETKKEKSKQENVNDLVDRVNTFNKKPKNAAGRNQEINEIRVAANELGLKFDDRAGKLVNEKGKKVQKRNTDAPSKEATNFDINNYSDETKSHFEAVSKNENSLMGLPIKGRDGRQLTQKQLKYAIKSVKDGKPNIAAQAIFDFLEHSVSEGGIEVTDPSTGRSAIIPMDEYMAAFKEPTKPLTDAEIEQLNYELNEDSFNFETDEHGQEIIHRETEQPSTKGTTTSKNEISGGKETTGTPTKETPKEKVETEVGKPPTEPPKPPTDTKGEEGGGKDKGILNRLHKATNVPAAAKKGFEEKGLKYEPKSNEENAQVAKAIIDELGIDEAILNAKANNFGGGVNSAVFAESLNRIKEAEDKATTPEAKLEQAIKFADTAIMYDEWARDKGRDISQIAEFYKKSPLGVLIAENRKRDEDFSKWAKPKEKSWKDFFEELKKEPEFEKVFQENVKEELKKERQEARKERISKVDKFFDDAKKNFEGGGAVYSTIIPPKIITAAIDGMKKAYHAGEKVAELVQEAIDFITEQMGKAPWDSEKFRKEWQEKLKDKTEKKPLTDEELKSKVLDRFRKKLKGLTEAQKDDVIRQAHKQLIDNGALEFDDFKKIIARVVGRGELTVEEANRMKELVKITNELEDAAKRAREERTVESFKKYKEQQVKTARAARELNEMFLNKPDIIRRITGIMQLNTLGIVSLINNPVYNIMNQSAVRFPIGLLNDVGDRVAKLIKKDFEQENNVLETQKDFWEMVGVGGKEAAQQLLTGLNRSDYIQKELYSEQIRPFKALRDLNLWRKGQKQLSKRQVIDKMLQGTVGIPAEAVARMLNIGDKPQRFAAAGAQAAAFAKTIGLKDIDKKLFMEFPREEAYRAYKAQGLSDAKAGEKADYIKDVIIKEGERSTFQQENLFNDLISAAAGKLFGGKDTGAASLAKTLAVSPYIKIPSNAFWSMYNLLNPEIAILQSIVHGTRSGIASRKGETNKSKLQLREARYWLAHAIVGMATRAVVISLVQAGLFTPSADEEDPKKEREAVGYFDKAGTMQIGEMKVSNRWLGQFGMLGNQMARQYQDMTPEQKENMDEFWNVVWGGMERAGLQEVENGILANTSSLAEFALGGGDMSRYMNNTLNLFTNIVQPGTIALFNRASLDEVPSSKGDSFLDKLNQNFAQRSTLYRKMFDVELRKKRDIWGQTMPKGGNVLSRMFGISKANPQIFARNLYDEFLRTNNRDFLPPAVTPTLNNQKLTADQTLKLEEYVGSERKKLIEPYINDMSLLIGFNKKYSELNDDEKVTILKTIYDIGSEYGKERFLTENPQFEKPKETLQERINDAKAGAFRLKTKYEARKE